MKAHGPLPVAVTATRNARQARVARQPGAVGASVVCKLNPRAGWQRLPPHDGIALQRTLLKSAIGVKLRRGVAGALAGDAVYYSVTTERAPFGLRQSLTSKANGCRHKYGRPEHESTGHARKVRVATRAGHTSTDVRGRGALPHSHGSGAMASAPLCG